MLLNGLHRETSCWNSNVHDMAEAIEHNADWRLEDYPPKSVKRGDIVHAEATVRMAYCVYSAEPVYRAYFHVQSISLLTSMERKFESLAIV